MPDDPTPTRLGKAMMVAAWLLVLALLTLFFNRYLEEQRNPNRDVVSRLGSHGRPEVVLKRNRAGHYVATAAINGQPVEVLVDTGATAVSVPESLARRLGLRFGAPLHTQTASGVITTYATTLDHVQLGAIAERGVAATINPHFDEVLLGMSFLKRLEFTQRGDTLILHPGAH